jgi:antitoxin ParD1/3/4
MSLQIAPEIVNTVRVIVGTGRYRDENAVLGEALKLLQERDALASDIQQGIDEIERGETVDGEEVFRRLEARAAEIAGRRQ